MIGSSTNPTYGTSIGNTLQLEWSSTNKLLFQGDISAVPVNDTTIVSVTHPDVYTKAEVDALIAAVKQDVLDSITFSSDFNTDRSIAGALHISQVSNSPVWQTTQDVEYIFDGNQSGTVYFDIAQSNPCLLYTSPSPRDY